MSTASSSRSPWTTSFKHLVNSRPFVAQKPARRFPMGNSPPKDRSIPHPRDRIPFWNIIAGDKIGIFRGHLKPVPEERQRVFEVFDVDKVKNLVDVKGLSGKGSSLANVPPMAKVHYSNVGLYMGKYTTSRRVNGQVIEEEQDVFATRLITTQPKWDPVQGHYIWRRFAASTWPPIEGYEKLPFGQRRRGRPNKGRTALIEIPWPVQKRWVAPEPSEDLDTLQEAVEAITWQPTTTGMSSLGSLTPSAFPPRLSPLEQTYLDATTSPSPSAFHSLPSDLPMELFLISELANPHSRMKKQRRWQDRLEHKEDLRTTMLREALRASQASENPRKRAIVRRETIFRWKARVEKEEEERKQLAWAKRGGEKDVEVNEKRRLKKQKRKDRQLREVVLVGGQKNQFIPPAGNGTEARI